MCPASKIPVCINVSKEVCLNIQSPKVSTLTEYIHKMALVLFCSVRVVKAQVSQSCNPGLFAFLSPVCVLISSRDARQMFLGISAGWYGQALAALIFA